MADTNSQNDGEELQFFSQSPVRNEVFEDYDPEADPDEVLAGADLPFDDNEAVKKEVAKPSSREDVFHVGLPSTAMGEAPFDWIEEDIDREEWEAAKDKPDDRLHNLWRAYRYGTEHTDPGDKRVRGQIVGELNPMIYKAVHDVGGPAPMGKLEEEGTRQVLKAADQYDPSYGAKLSTYAHDKLFPNGSTNVLTNQVRKFGDSVQPSEDRFARVMEYKEMIENFERKNGRKPSVEESADRINGLSVKDIKKMKREVADEIATTDMLNDDDTAIGDSFHDKDVLKAVYYDLGPKEQTAMEYMFPDALPEGEEPPVPIDSGGMSWIGDQIGKSSSGMSKLKSKIEGKIKDLM